MIVITVHPQDTTEKIKNARQLRHTQFKKIIIKQ